MAKTSFKLSIKNDVKAFGDSDKIKLQAHKYFSFYPVMKFKCVKGILNYVWSTWRKSSIFHKH